MKNRILSILLALALLCAILPTASLRASAATTSGTCGDNLIWSFDSSTGTLTIEGSGKMNDYYGYEDMSAPWYDWIDSIKKITIGNSVTSIGRLAFGACTSLTSVTIGNSVTSIGEAAFWNCTSLTNVKIPNSVTSIDMDAFEYCTSLTSVTIPESLTSIGVAAFSACNSLTKITVASGNPNYCSDSHGVLFNKNKTKLIQFPGGYQGSYAIPSSVTSIGNHAFSNCKSLTSVTIPNSVTSIGAWAFEDCTSLTSVTIPNSVTSIGNAAFCECTALTSVTIGNSVTSIGRSTFEHCTSLTSVTIGNSVTSIGEYAFRDCTSLTSVAIPNSVTSIGDDAFYECTSLTSVTIPSSVTSIGANAFYHCTSLTNVTIPDSVTSIGGYAFQYCTALTSVTIPNSVTSIGNAAFCECTALTSVTIGNSVTSIDRSTFEHCTSLTSVTIGNSVTNIVEYAFYGCTGLTIYGVSGSYAETYANENNIPFVAVTAPIITTQPSNASAALGKTVTFRVAAAGFGLSYQWQYKRAGDTSWTNWSGKTEASLVVTAGTNNNGCRFRCVVKNSYGTVTSNAAQLTIPDAPPAIQTQPSNASAALGKTATFKVVATGSNLTYQWQYKRAGATSWTNWSGKTEATLVVTAGSNNNGCRFRCVVKNSYGSVTSNAAQLTIPDAPPAIQTQPSNASAALGKTATFKVVAAGSGLSYQWQYKRAGATSWTNWSGKTAATLSVTAGSNNNGCRFRCVVKNSYGTVTSNAAQLTITNAAPVIDTQPSNASAALGKTATFKVVAAGAGLTYQWQYKRAGATSWTNWSGKTSATLTVTAGSNNNGCQYRCVVKNSYGSVTSKAATLTVK